MLNSLMLAGSLLSLATDTAAAVPVSDRAFAAALNGLPIRVLQAKDFKELTRGTITGVAMPHRCTLRLRIQGASQPETVPLGELRFVQGDGVSIDIASRTGGQREYIIQIGEQRYAQAFQLLTSRATSCGARLIGPPPIVTIPR